MDVPRTPSWQIKLRGVIGSLGAQERRFAEYLLNSFAGIEKEPIAVLAKEAQVSEATVVRVCHKMGYSGLKELKIVVARENETAGSFDGGIGGQYMDELKERVFMGAIRALQDTMNLIDEDEVGKATKVLCNANYISIYGVGGSVPVARSLKHQLMKLGIPSNVYNEFQPSIIAAEKYNKGDWNQPFGRILPGGGSPADRPRQGRYDDLYHQLRGFGHHPLFGREVFYHLRDSSERGRQFPGPDRTDVHYQSAVSECCAEI